MHLSPTGKLPEQGGTTGDLDAGVALIRLFQALDELRPRDRLMFTLRFVEGMELTEVAAATGVSLATLKRHLPLIWQSVCRLVEKDPALAEYVERFREGKAKHEQ